MTTSGKTQQALSFKIQRDLILVAILSALLIGIIAFFPDSPARILLGLPFILFFPGYVLISALFPHKEGLGITERLALSFGLSIAVTSLIGLALNYTAFGIRLYPFIFSLFSFILLISMVGVYRRRQVSAKNVFAPFSQMSILGWFEEIKSEFIKFDNVNRTTKIIAIICFILIPISLFVAWNTPATEYEPCIFAATPPLLWISLILSIACGITVIVRQIYNRGDEEHSLWKIGFLLIFLSYIISISLHIIRGYYMWCMIGDPASHIGWIKEAINAGYVAHTNFYPILHVYAAQISQILIIDLVPLHKLLPLFFATLSIPFMYCFAKSILPRKGQVILATIASCILLHGWYLNFTPNHHSVLLLPMFLFILVKAFTTRKIEWSLLLIIMVFLLPPFHPVPVMAISIMLIALWMPKRVFTFIDKAKHASQRKGRSLSIFNFTLLLILVVWAITWISEFGVWDATIRNIYTVIVEGGPTHLERLVDKAELAEGYGISVIEHIFRRMWGTFVFIILALICLPILWKDMRTHKEYINLFSLYGPLAIIGLFIALLYNLDVGFGPLRMLFFVVMICTIFVGFILYKMIDKIREIKKRSIHKFALSPLIILMTALFIHGILIIYPSPYVVSASWHTTQTEVAGMDWTFHHRDLDLPITGISIAPHRFAHLLLTPEEQAEQRIPWYLPEDIRVPHRFGYDNYTSLSASFKNDLYMAVLERCRSIYLDVLPELAEIRWMPGDFERLEHDQGLNKIYTNGGFDLWKINAKGE
ncbi:DUF1616 domain-containing protein [Dehalococcoidia bacterium]|nr:DUF1616 domain-containing protein [Dehalococcoidia bacterium]